MLVQWIVACVAGTTVAALLAATQSGVGILASGAVLAVPQWFVLRRDMDGAALWVPVAAVGFPIALVAGIAAGTVLGGAVEQLTPEAANGFRASLRLGVLLISSAVVGAVLGITQSTILFKSMTTTTWKWTAGSAVGAVLYFAINAGAGLALDSKVGSTLSIVVAGGLGGAAYGLSTGLMFNTREFQ